jgi:hypothetical protein
VVCVVGCSEKQIKGVLQMLNCLEDVLESPLIASVLLEFREKSDSKESVSRFAAVAVDR